VSPADFKVVSVNNEQRLLATMDPRPATIDTQQVALGALAGERLFQRMLNPDAAPHPRSWRRASCARRTSTATATKYPIQQVNQALYCRPRKRAIGAHDHGNKHRRRPQSFALPRRPPCLNEEDCPMRPRIHPNAAFTLVELLVVIGIIAVLIAILLPALQQARRQASMVQCQSNMKQLAMGMLMYIQQNKGKHPPSAIADGAPGSGAMSAVGGGPTKLVKQKYVQRA
jgi:prepilin-type N-terminal cleavage/methylation domain-containing protein